MMFQGNFISWIMDAVQIVLEFLNNKIYKSASTVSYWSHSS